MSLKSPKAKGSAFERVVCAKLSLWVTNGKHDDLFWRSAMSGGRGTLRARKTEGVVPISGDITAVRAEGHSLTDAIHVECKHLAKAGFESFIIKSTGPLQRIWEVTAKQAVRHGKIPMLIVRQNLFPVVVVMPPYSYVTNSFITWRVSKPPGIVMVAFDDMLKQPYHRIRPRLSD